MRVIKSPTLSKFIVITLFLLPLINGISALSISDCERETNEWLINQCYSQVAIDNNDSNLCKRSGADAGYCRYQIALKLDNLTLCEHADKFQYECYKDIILPTGNFSLCQMTANEEKCFNKLYEETQDQKICEYLLDKPIDCLCADDETLEGKSCIKLECKEEEIAEDHACKNRCGESYEYKKGKCVYKCDFGYTPIGSGCSRSSVIWVLYYFSRELPALFVIFVLLTLAFKTNHAKRFLNAIKRDAILKGIKCMLLYLNTLIFMFLFVRQPYSLIKAFEFADTPPFVLLSFMFLIPFVLGITTHRVMAFMESKKYKYGRFVENAVIGLGIVLFIEYLKIAFSYTSYTFIFAEDLYYFVSPLLYVIEKITILDTYSYLAITSLYFWAIFTLTISFSRNLYEIGLRKAVIKTKKKTPAFIKRTIFYALLFLPLLVIILPHVGFIGFPLVESIGDFPDLYFRLNIEEFVDKHINVDMRSSETRFYYSLVIYAFIWAIVLTLAKSSANYLWRKFAR